MGLAWGRCDESEQIGAAKAGQACEEPRAAVLLEWGQTHPERTGAHREGRDCRAEGSASAGSAVGSYRCSLDRPVAALLLIKQQTSPLTALQSMHGGPGFKKLCDAFVFVVFFLEVRRHF